MLQCCTPLNSVIHDPCRDMLRAPSPKPLSHTYSDFQSALVFLLTGRPATSSHTNTHPSHEVTNSLPSGEVLELPQSYTFFTRSLISSAFIGLPLSFPSRNPVWASQMQVQPCALACAAYLHGSGRRSLGIPNLLNYFCCPYSSPISCTSSPS